MPRQSLNDRFPKRQLKPAERTISFLARRSNPQIDGRPTPASRALTRGGGGGATPSLPGSTQNVQTLPDDPNNAAVGQIYNVPGGAVEGSRLVTVIQNGDGSKSYRDVIQGADAWNAPYVGQWGTSGYANGQFTGIRGIAVDPVTGNVYVASDQRIQKFSANGTYIATIAGMGGGDGQINTPWGLLHIGSGFLAVADSGNHRYQWFLNDVFYSKGGTFGSGGSFTGQMNGPRGIAYDKTGGRYLIDTGNNRIVAFNPNDSAAGVDATHAFSLPSAILIVQQRYIISDTGKHRLVIIPLAGGEVIVGGRGSSPGQFNTPLGIAVDVQGNIYVADSGNHRILVFDPNGIFLGSFGSFGTGNGQFNTPTAVAVTNNYIYVGDSGNSRVQMFANPTAGQSFVVGEYQGTWAPAAIAGDSGQFTSVTIPGAALGDYVEVGHTGARSNSVYVWLEAYVSGANTVTVLAYNRHPTTAMTLGSGTLRVRVTR